MDTESDERRLIHNPKKNIIQKLIGRKLGVFDLNCRMHNSRKIKELMFGSMDGTKREEDLTRNIKTM